jgi:hypothetical protein
VAIVITNPQRVHLKFVLFDMSHPASSSTRFARYSSDANLATFANDPRVH